MTKVLAVLVLPFLMAAESDEGFVRITPGELDWVERASGTAYVVLTGDPQSEGLYIQRNRFPPGAFSRPHYHDQDRFITVITGTWYTGIGADFDPENTVPIGPGSYMKHPAGGVHFDGAKDAEVIVEIRGMGPVETVFVEEAP
ncbi:MAG: cupin domain-containing protein [Gammaproteobacteria bacterium]